MTSSDRNRQAVRRCRINKKTHEKQMAQYNEVLEFELTEKKMEMYIKMHCITDLFNERFTHAKTSAELIRLQSLYNGIKHEIDELISSLELENHTPAMSPKSTK